MYAGLPADSGARAPKLRLVGKSIEAGRGRDATRNPRARSARLRVAERLDEGLAA